MKTHQSGPMPSNNRTTDLPITATASGSLKPANRSQLRSHSSRLRVRHTREVEEVGLLVKFVEDRSRAILDIAGSQNRNAVWRKLLGEGGASVMIFESRNAGRDCSLLSTAVRSVRILTVSYVRQV